MISLARLQELIETEVRPLGIADCCLGLVELVLNSVESKPVFTHTHLLQALKKNYSFEEIQKAVNYLKSPPIQLFTQQFQYIDDEEVIHDITIEDLRAAILDNALPHPDNGHLDSAFREKVYIVFVGNKAAIQ